MKNKLIILVGIIILVALGGVVLTRQGYAPAQAPDSDQAAVETAAPTAEEIQQVEEQKAALAPAAAAERYKHPTYGFSFEKPAGYSVGALPNEAGGQTLIVQPTSNAGTNGFQIYISPLDEPIELTPTLIKEQLPGTSVNNAQKIVLDGIGTGMMFASNNEAFGGKSYEIWFTGKGNLYQISSYASFADTLQNIIGTWKF